jgi:hypothetical protein
MNRSHNNEWNITNVTVKEKISTHSWKSKLDGSKPYPGAQYSLLQENLGIIHQKELCKIPVTKKQHM